MQHLWFSNKGRSLTCRHFDSISAKLRGHMYCTTHAAPAAGCVKLFTLWRDALSASLKYWVCSPSKPRGWDEEPTQAWGLNKNAHGNRNVRCITDTLLSAHFLLWRYKGNSFCSSINPAHLGSVIHWAKSQWRDTATWEAKQRLVPLSQEAKRKMKASWIITKEKDRPFLLSGLKGLYQKVNGNRNSKSV